MAAMFHLFTHAMFKALLFLCSGAIIVIIGSNFKEYMGGLHKYMPITNICFLIGCLAIAGIPPFAGFFSKDEIISACNALPGVEGQALKWIMTIVAGMTAFYMFRLYYVIFWGSSYYEQDPDNRRRPQEVPFVMWGPLVFLAAISVCAGWIPFGHFVSANGLNYDIHIDWSIATTSIIAAVIGIALATEEYGAAFFKNGARPGGVLEHPGVLKDPSKLRESWHAVYGGTMNTGRIAVLEEGVKYQQIAIPPEEAQFLETRKFQIDEIARLYRVPPHMVGDLEKSSFSNIEQQSLEFVKYTLNPWVVRWEQSLQKALLTDKERKDYFIRFNVDGLLRGDYKSRMEGYAIGRQNGWLSANDIRSLEDMNPIESTEGGDLYLINGNMTKLRDAGLFANKKGEGDETQILELGAERGREACLASGR